MDTGGNPTGPTAVTVDGAALARIRDYRLDFVLSLVDAAYPPELLDIPRYGVWRYHFGDLTQRRGGPVGFWETYEHRPISNALLVRLQLDPATVIILRDGHLRTNLLSCVENQRQLLSRFTHWPAQLCTDIRNGTIDRLCGPAVCALTPQRTRPTRWQLLEYQRRRLIRAARAAFRSLFRHEQWNVGIVNQPIAAFLQSRPAAVRWLPSTKRSEFRADPFGLLRNGRLIVFCEHFRYGVNLGFIVALDPEAAGAAQRVEIGPRPAVHLSYPYLLRAQNQLLCMPESSEASEVAWYEVERFPDRWVKRATVLTGVTIVDATVFSHDNYWWLAGSEVAPKGANCELHLWYAQSVSGPWHAHPGNPVKIDVRSSRPAGTPFLLDGILYRPAQDCSKTYGGQVIINRIFTLTPTAFREEAVATVAPDAAGPYPDGLHTISQVGDLTLIDGKRRVFVPAEFRRVLIKLVRSLLSH
jgi:hypothetical protein